METPATRLFCCTVPKGNRGSHWIQATPEASPILPPAMHIHIIEMESTENCHEHIY